MAYAWRSTVVQRTTKLLRTLPEDVTAATNYVTTYHCPSNYTSYNSNNSDNNGDDTDRGNDSSNCVDRSVNADNTGDDSNKYDNSGYDTYCGIL